MCLCGCGYVCVGTYVCRCVSCVGVCVYEVCVWRLCVFARGSVWVGVSCVGVCVCKVCV